MESNVKIWTSVALVSMTVTKLQNVTTYQEVTIVPVSVGMKALARCVQTSTSARQEHPTATAGCHADQTAPTQRDPSLASVKLDMKARIKMELFVMISTSVLTKMADANRFAPTLFLPLNVHVVTDTDKMQKTHQNVSISMNALRGRLPVIRMPCALISRLATSASVKKATLGMESCANWTT